MAAQSGTGRNRAATPRSRPAPPPGPSTARGVSKLTAESASGNRTGRPRFALGRYAEATVLS